MPIIDTSFENGNGEYRPRIPQYPEIQDYLGTAVNAVLVGDADPQEALDRAQAQAERLF
jgi:multiple sugar transport system substrate-binding protein